MSQAALRDNFLKKHPYIRYGLGEWRQYDGGVWESLPELVVKNHIQTIVQRSSTRLSNGVVTSISELVKQRTYIPDRLFDAKPHVLTFKDCCLDLTDYTITPHCPDHYSTTKMQFDYDPDARSPAWEKAAEGFPYREFLQDFSGLALTTETKYEIAVWLHGPPGGGKSTFIVGLEAMLGPKCSTLGLNEIAHSTFALSQIPGKTLLVSTEQPSHYVKCVSLLNALISGETTTINRKFRDSFQLTPRAKMLWAMNELPIIPSAGSGLFRRVYPVYWPSLPEGERNPDIKEEIINSGMAVVNWALPGLKRLRANGVNVPEELKAARQVYQSENDIMLCFVNECCERSTDLTAPSGELYDRYQHWCALNGHKKPLVIARFSMELERLGFIKMPRIASGVSWRGLHLKPETEDFSVQ